jgi:hypothetical protein
MDLTPEQSVQILFKAASMALLNKQDHVICEQAATLLSKLIKEKVEVPRQESKAEGVKDGIQS